jgi:hypothetical protein
MPVAPPKSLNDRNFLVRDPKDPKHQRKSTKNNK